MGLEKVAIRLRSAELSCRQLSELAGREPSTTFEKNAPVSRRNPRGPVHKESTCVYESGIEGGTFFDHVILLRPLLERIAEEMPENVYRDFFVLAYGRDLGSVFDVDLQSIELAFRAQCPIMFDVYCDGSDGEGSSASR